MIRFFTYHPAVFLTLLGFFMLLVVLGLITLIRHTDWKNEPLYKLLTGRL